MLSKLVHTNSYKNVHAGNESIDGRMTACDDKIGWRTKNATTNQRTAERRQRQRRWRQLRGSAAATAARRQCTAQWRQRGGGSVEAVAAAAAPRRHTARRLQAMDRGTARATAIDGAGQEGGTTRGWRVAM